MLQALNNLQNALSYDVNVSTQGNEIAYALYVLARNRKAAISDLRYYADTKLSEFSSPLARAQIGAALGLYGDAQRATTIFSNALGLSRDSIIGVGGGSTAGSGHHSGTLQAGRQAVGEQALDQHAGTDLDAARRPFGEGCRQGSEARSQRR